MSYVPELDRWRVWMVVKSLDLPYHKLMPLLSGLDIRVHRDEEGEYISKTEFREMLYSVEI